MMLQSKNRCVMHVFLDVHIWCDICRMHIEAAPRAFVLQMLVNRLHLHVGRTKVGLDINQNKKKDAIATLTVNHCAKKEKEIVLLINLHVC